MGSVVREIETLVARLPVDLEVRVAGRAAARQSGTRGNLMEGEADAACAPACRLVVRLKGGIGNQMFQYAAALGVAIRNRVPLYLDSYTGFAKDAYERSFRLQCFKLSSPLLSRDECYDLWRKTRYIRAYRRYREQFRFEWLGRNFDPALYSLRVRRDVLLEGNWQSPGFFEDVAGRVREEFRIAPELSPETRDVAEEIRAAPASISIHLRRLHGLSATGKRVANPYFICDKEYYRAAIQHIQRRAGPLEAFVFADGPFPPGELDLPCPVRIVDHNGPEREYEDLYLMSVCRHHVIANSSFSWWAAWLGRQEGTVVCAPANFTPQKAPPIRDVYPSDWVVI